MYNITSALVQNIIYSIIHSSSREEATCKESVTYEISLWIDGMTRSGAAGFGDLIAATQKATIQHFTIVTNVWKRYFPREKLPKVTFSPLLSLSLIELSFTQNEVPEEFRLLILDVTTKLLLAQNDNRLLACLLLHVANQEKMGNSCLPYQNELHTYAESILVGDLDEMGENELALVKKVFGNNTYHAFVPQVAHSGKSIKYYLMQLDEGGNVFSNSIYSSIFLQSMKYMCEQYEHVIGSVLTSSLPFILFVST